MGCVSSKKNISVCKSLPIFPAAQQETHSTAVEIAPVSLVLMGEKVERQHIVRAVLPSKKPLTQNKEENRG